MDKVWGDIIIALLSAFVSITVCLTNNYFSKKKDDKTLEAQANERRAQAEEKEKERFNDLIKMMEDRNKEYTAQTNKIIEEIKSENQEKQNNYIQEINKLDTKIQVFNVQLESLTTEVRKHNNFATRMPVVEGQVADLANRIGFLEQMINTLISQQKKGQD